MVLVAKELPWGIDESGVSFKMKRTDNSKCGQGCGATGPLIRLLVEMQKGTDTLENSLAISYKVKHILTLDPTNPNPR